MSVLSNLIRNPANLFTPTAIMAGGENFGDVGRFLFGKEGKSRPQIAPALVGPAQFQDILNNIRSLVNQPYNAPAYNFSSPYSGQLQQALSSPYTPTTAENDILNAVMGKTSAAFASRGLGASPIAASQVAASIAPTLVQARQNQIQSLLTALGLDVQQAGVGVQARRQDVEAGLNQRVAALNALSQLLGFGRPTPLGQVSNAGTPGFIPTVLQNVNATIPVGG